MDEEKLLEMIKNSAKDIPIPDTLKPDSLADKFEKSGKGQEEAQDIAKNPKRKILPACLTVAAAAAVVLLISLPMFKKDSKLGSAASETSRSTQPATEVASKKADSVDDLDGLSASVARTGESLSTPSSYSEVYQKLKSITRTYSADIAENAIAYDAAESKAVAGAASDYSQTNRQEAGVDEGDFVKTDGKYIYVFKRPGKVKIISADGAVLSETSLIESPNADDEIKEMYVNGDSLVLIADSINTALESKDNQTYHVQDLAKVCVYTYDISDRANPVLKGSTSQSGYYNTSRMTGDMLYVFSDYVASNIVQDDEQTFVPKSNENVLPCSDIYMPGAAVSPNYMMITSTDIKKPDTVIDQKALLSGGAGFYASQNAVYINASAWFSLKSAIVKINLDNGKINPTEAAPVPGYINDSFSMNEYNGYLRVVTTAWENDSSNGVYIFDKDMKMVGSVDGLAKGESIYAARFLGDTGYFVTYKETDPLFSVDLSDPTNPKILGELKITGFSEYLHFYGENMLFGLGWETDPQSGNHLGIKLSMFDISDPANVKEVNKFVIEDVNYCQALYEYKALLIDPEKNLIGFTIDNQSNGVEKTSYLVFEYDPQKGFNNLLSENVTKDVYYYMDSVRGIYIGGHLYICDDTSIRAYDMDDGFKQVAKFNY